MTLGYQDYTLEDWCNRFTEANGDSWQSTDSVTAWLQIVESATTSIAELVRLEQYSALIEALGKSFGWLCCFAGRYSKPRGEPFEFTLSLSEMIWHKYPGVCYRCAHRFTEEEIRTPRYLPCTCLATPHISEADKEICQARKAQAHHLKPRPITLDQWTLMTKTIYGPNHREYNLASICLHFLEEVGEVAK